MQHKEFLQWPVLLTVRLQENNQPLKINVRAGSNEQKMDEWVGGNEEGVKEKMGGTNPKMAERRGGTLGAWKKTQGWELNQLQVREGRTSRWQKKRRDPSTSSNLLKGNGWRWVHHFASEGLGRREGKGFSLCGWVMQEALIRHVWAEVILDVSHTPAGQLVLGQV